MCALLRFAWGLTGSFTQTATKEIDCDLLGVCFLTCIFCVLLGGLTEFVLCGLKGLRVCFMCFTNDFWGYILNTTKRNFVAETV